MQNLYGYARAHQTNTSMHAFRIATIRELIKKKKIKIAKISRGANVVSHELARLERV